MTIQDIKINQCLFIDKKHNDSKYYSNKFHGVVTSVNLDTQVVHFLNAKGDPDEVCLAEEPEKYTYHISELSEVEFLRQIDKNIEELENAMNRIIKDKQDNLEWRETFQNQISLLGKLARFLKSL